VDEVLVDIMGGGLGVSWMVVLAGSDLERVWLSGERSSSSQWMRTVLSMATQLVGYVVCIMMGHCDWVLGTGEVLRCSC
jgi:hypothetical protein